ncbi:hypothetical protein [Micavibrio aeruginosavorus]|uniref:hypothetical protein n=1 Tax=Micavibrio aeruginosavorus TaxID=349221 RepID=UPI003F4AE459
MFSNRFHRVFLTAAVLIGMAGGAVAATDDVVDENVKTITPRTVGISLLRPDDGSGEAILRLMAPSAISGCPVIGPLKTEMNVNSIYLDITVDGYTIDQNNLETHRGACATARQYAYADIPLDRALLHGNNVAEIRFTVNNEMDYYTVNLNEERLELLPRRQMRVKPATGADSATGGLTFWYYPKGTVILSVPAAPAGSDTTNPLDQFASQHGLKRLDSVMHGFSAIAGKAGQAYYIDGTGALGAVAGKDPVSVGTTVIDGRTMDVYSRQPGMNE